MPTSERMKVVSAAVLAAGLLAGSLSCLGVATSPAVASPVATSTGPHVFGWGFCGPDSVPVAGADLFVANGFSDSVTELSASSGALVRVISGPGYEFRGPAALTVVGTDLFVANSNEAAALAGGSPTAEGGSVTEVDTSTGELVKVISGATYHLSGRAVAVVGNDLFVANSDGRSLACWSGSSLAPRTISRTRGPWR